MFGVEEKTMTILFMKAQRRGVPDLKSYIMVMELSQRLESIRFYAR